MGERATGKAIVQSAITRICPGCKRSALRTVPGSKGKAGSCRVCGWFGPMGVGDG